MRWLSNNFKYFFFSCSKIAVNFRRLLAEDKHDLESLKLKYDEGKRDALYEVVKKLNQDFQPLTDEEVTELVDILEGHFDPTKKPIVDKRHQEGQNTGNGTGNGNNMRRRRRGGMGVGGGRRNSRGSSNMIDKENQVRARSNSNHRRRRRSSTDGGKTRFGGNNNNEMNNNNNYEKTGAMRKEHQMHDNNANHMISAN